MSFEQSWAKAHEPEGFDAFTTCGEIATLAQRYYTDRL